MTVHSDDLSWADDVADAVKRAVATDPRYRHVAELLVDVAGTTVRHERWQADRPRPVYSVTKSVVGLLVGLAIDQGRCDDLDTVVEHATGGTLRHLLTMQRGAVCRWSDIDDLRLMDDPLAWILSMEHDAPPGTVFRYDNCATELAGRWLADQLGESLEHFARRHLFDPLGIAEVVWESDQDGASTAADGIHLTGTALVRLGRLVLDEGRVHGRELVPPSWVNLMTRPTSAGGPPEDHPYGIGVWLPPGRVMFGGWAGQHVSVVPARNAVVVATGEASELHPDWLPAQTVVDRFL